MTMEPGEPREPSKTAVAATSTADPGASYLKWGAIFGGAAVAVAMSVVFLQFGAGVGLAVGPPMLEDGSASWNVWVAGLWVVLVALASSAAGGYIAGRMRSRWGDAVEAEVEFRDGTHGLVVWGVSTLTVGLMMAAMSALSALAAGTAAVSAEVEATAAVLRYTANVSTIFTFATGAGAAIGAAAAWFGATIGGQHRDEGLSMYEIVPRPFRRKAT